MAEIRLISTNTVHPASRHESAERIELTPWDLQLLLLDPIQKGLLFLKPTPSEEKVVENTVIDHLKTSLCRTLDFFPPLTGRLAIIENHDDDNTTSFFIDCNNAGAHFIHAVADDLTVTDILDPVHVPRIVHSFFPLNGVLNHQGVSKPLLAVQVTELVNGLFIGCTINHTLLDGSSFWHFFNSWSEISRGFDSLSRAPIFKRWFPNDFEIPIRIPLFHKQLVDHHRFVPPPLQERVFHFTKEKIRGLKAKANGEMGTTQISSLQALLAHLWLSVLRCRRVSGEQEATYMLLIGVRPRLKPPLPNDYFGNAVKMGAVTIKTGMLLEQGLGWAAWEMNKMVASQTDVEIKSFLKSWVENPKLPKMGAMASNSLVTGSSPRFNVYGTDFGWGKPVAVRSGEGNKFDGKMTVFPGVEEGSIDIEACLLPETLNALGDDAEFLEAVTTI